MTVIEVKSCADFDKYISQQKTVVVDFYAVWCGPCKMIAPKVEEFSKKYTNVVFLKVDVDNLSDVAAKCDIRSMPTFQIYKGGEKVGEVIGAAAKPLEDKIKEFA